MLNVTNIKSLFSFFILQFFLQLWYGVFLLVNDLKKFCNFHVFWKTMTAFNIGFTSCTATDTWSRDRFIFMSIYIWRTNLNFFFWCCSFIYGGRISTSSDGVLTKPLRWYIRFFLGGDNMLVRSIRTYHSMVGSSS